MPKPLFNWTPDFYSRLAGHYDWLARIFLSLGEKGKRKIAEHVPNGNLLDVACGTGSLLKMVAHQTAVGPFGCDISFGMLQEAQRQLPEAVLVQASFHALPFRGGTFDMVVETNSVSAFEFGVEEVLDEMLRVCRYGGLVCSADYGSPPRWRFWHRLMAWMDEFFGDYPHDYVVLFQKLGYRAQVEYLGFDRMYQVVRVKKEVA